MRGTNVLRNGDASTNHDPNTREITDFSHPCKDPYFDFQ